MTDSAIVGVEVAGGKELWQIPFPDEWHENIVTPVVAGDILVVSGKQKGTFGYRVEKKGAAFAAAELWRNADLPMYMSTPVTDGAFIYGFGHRRKGQLFCLDARTGAAKWTTEGRGGENAAIQSVGDNLLVLSTDGNLIVVKRTPEKFEEVRRYKVADSQTWAHPVLLGREVVIRDADSLAVWSLER
jgi:outer membrane protein assembly factor BamB